MLSHRSQSVLPKEKTKNSTLEIHMILRDTWYECKLLFDLLYLDRSASNRPRRPLAGMPLFLWTLGGTLEGSSCLLSLGRWGLAGSWRCHRGVVQDSLHGRDVGLPCPSSPGRKGSLLRAGTLRQSQGGGSPGGGSFLDPGRHQGTQDLNEDDSMIL